MHTDDAGVWRRNLFAVTAATFIGYTGFTLFIPVLPPFIAELGARGTGEVAWWSGLSLGITSVVSSLLSPMWGRLADRVGRKVVLVRAFAGCAAVMAAVPFVARPWHVFALRAVQGLFTGYGGLAVAMAAESSPPGQLSSSIGFVQSAQRLAPAIGPVLGGVIAAVVGVRQSFFASAAIYGLASIVVASLYDERPLARERLAAQPAVGLRSMLALPDFMLLLVLVGGIQYVDRSIGPVLPLYVVDLGALPSQAPAVAGLLFSVIAASAAAGHHLGGRALRRWSRRNVMMCGCALITVAIVTMGVARSVPWFCAAAAIFGLAAGATMTAAYTAAGLVAAVGTHATAFGWIASASLAGIALGPALSGLIAAADLRLVFAADAAIVGGLLVVLVRGRSSP